MDGISAQLCVLVQSGSRQSGNTQSLLTPHQPAAQGALWHERVFTELLKSMPDSIVQEAMDEAKKGGLQDGSLACPLDLVVTGAGTSCCLWRSRTGSRPARQVLSGTEPELRLCRALSRLTSWKPASSQKQADIQNNKLGNKVHLSPAWFPTPGGFVSEQLPSLSLWPRHARQWGFRLTAAFLEFVC